MGDGDVGRGRGRPRWRSRRSGQLSEVTEELGPTHLAPLSVTDGLPALPHVQRRNERPALYEQEVSGSGPAGTIVVYSTDTFHRATELTVPGTDTASTSAIAMLTTPGPLATPGATSHFIPIGGSLWNKRTCGSYSFLGFLPLVTRTGPQRLLRVSKPVIPASMSHHGRVACNPRRSDPDPVVWASTIPSNRDPATGDAQFGWLDAIAAMISSSLLPHSVLQPRIAAARRAIAWY